MEQKENLKMFFTFDSPDYLLFLIFVPILFLVYFLSIKKTGSRAISFANIKAIEKIKGVSLFSKNFSILILFIILVFLLSFSLSGMVVHVEKESTEFSYVLAIDSSESMTAEDYSPNRLGVAKKSAINFVDSFPQGIKLGVVSFSGITKIENKVTEDKLAIKNSIRKINPSEVGGTNLLMPIQTSVNLLNDENAKAIILLSDGQINVQSLEEVISYSNENNVVIHALGIGSEEGGKVNDYFLSKIDKDSLKSLAYSTGGKYFHISSEKELNNAFNDVIDFTHAKFSFSLKNYLLISSIILICIIWILWCTRFKIIP